MSDAPLPEPDRIEGAPHPRDTPRLLGQEAAEAAFLEAFATGRLHHGWLLTGPRGVGKATLAWRLARFLLSTPLPGGDAGLFGEAPPAPQSLDVDPEHPVARRIKAGSEAGLFVLRRPADEKTKRLKQQITVDEVRKLKNFFALSAAEGGRRVVIVDAADEMNVSAANALLKLLEEPPENAILLLVAHQPSRLLPTIRSRCRELRLAALPPAPMAEALAQTGAEAPAPAEVIAELTAGSVGAAVRLANLDGYALYAEIVGLLASLPRLDTARAMKLAEKLAARGAEERLNLALDLFDLALARLARTGVTGAPPAVEAAPGERETFARLAPHAGAGRAWAEVAQAAGARARHGRAVNLDPQALILDTVFKIQKTAAGHAA